LDSKTKQSMETTYNYIFWNNQFEEIWYAIPRDQYLTFFNGNRDKAKGVVKSKNILTLIKVIDEPNLLKSNK